MFGFRNSLLPQFVNQPASKKTAVLELPFYGCVLLFVYVTFLCFSDHMKILVFTRIENGTGGDQALLFMIVNALLPGVPEHSEICLILSYDTASQSRANSIRAWWNTALEQRGHRGIVWFNNRGDASGTANFKLNMSPDYMTSEDWTEFGKFIFLGDPLYLFVVAGWAHQLNEQDFLYMHQIGIGCHTKIMLCAPPGSKDINTRLLQKLHDNAYQFIYLQPGMRDNDAGFPLPNQLDRTYMESDECQTQWLNHINQYMDPRSELLGPDSPTIVIYCSKDSPGIAGRGFIQRIARQVSAEDKENYLVVLIGTEFKNRKDWIALLKNNPIGKTVIADRTPSTEILMRGLRDARFSMATGSFSILEAKFLGIDRCEYLCPAHLTDFGLALNDERIPAASRVACFDQYFSRGQSALLDVGNIPRGIPPTILMTNQSWRAKSHDHKAKHHGHDIDHARTDVLRNGSDSTHRKSTNLLSKNAQITQVFSQQHSSEIKKSLAAVTGINNDRMVPKSNGSTKKNYRSEIKKDAPGVNHDTMVTKPKPRPL